MVGNYSLEYASLLFSLIVLIYSYDRNMVPTLSNKIFRLCLYTVVLSIAVSISSFYALTHMAQFPEIVLHGIVILFYLLTPLITVLFLMYIITHLQADSSRTRLVLRLTTLPFLIYSLLVLTNPLTRLIYRLDPPYVYQAGQGLLIVYSTVYLYILAMYVIILRNRQEIRRNSQLVFLIFPMLATLLVFIQQYLPSLVLIGTASTSALLIVYLYLQNKRIVTDDLTDLPNRKAFSQSLELGLKRRQHMDILLISLDDFKVVNNQFGQPYGDQILHEISAFLKQNIPLQQIFRYGGDEFAIIIPEKSRTSARSGPGGQTEYRPDGKTGARQQGKAGARWDGPVDKAGSRLTIDRQVARFIKSRFSEPWGNEPATCKLTTSIAVARIPEQAKTVEDTISLLEHCITHSKANGKSKVIFANETTVAKIRRRNQIVEILKEAVAQDRIQVHYQPIYSIRDKRFVSAEALIRLNHPELGMISPAEFIPIAEKTGLIVELGYKVLDKACQLVRQLELARTEFDAISVNFSVLQMMQEDLVERVLAIIRQNQVDPKRIHIEITESLFTERYDTIRKIMDELFRHGILFYLDDFGIGYSNIATMIDLPIKYIKLDKSLLYRAQNMDKSFHVIAALARAFSDSDIKVVIEGVENLRHQSLADQLCADYIQGYLLARPLTDHEVIEYLNGPVVMTGGE